MLEERRPSRKYYRQGLGVFSNTLCNSYHVDADLVHAYSLSQIIGISKTFYFDCDIVVGAKEAFRFITDSM